MPSRTFAANKSSLFAITGSTELGGGQDEHLPVGGPHNGYTFTAAVQFALSFADVRRITSATLRVRTTTRVHVAFSSSPDFYIARATGSWTANSSASSGEGGSGWGTSPTVYPGPPSTSTGRVSKRASTAENAWVEVDITAIVRAWAPSVVEGGGGHSNYGVLLSRVASGDITEFYSFRAGTAGNRPEIVMVYETDTPPPAPTITGPTGVVTSLKPPLTATVVDPDGDPIEAADIEVRKAAAVVYSALGTTSGVSATAISHVPATNLPAGDLTVRMRASAAGVFGAWSADHPFTVDRAPVVGAFTAPPATVSGSRRPPITAGWTDPDGDAADRFDVEVYSATGGVPEGAAVYKRTGLSTTITGTTVSHTPTSDLPGGDLLVRVRVHTGVALSSGGSWSPWSAYHPFRVVLTVGSIAWTNPSEPGAGWWARTSGGYADPDAALSTWQAQAIFTVTAPSGKTITSLRRRITQLDPAPVLVADWAAFAGSLVGTAGGQGSPFATVLANSNGTRWQIDVEIGDSGGGLVVYTRVGGVQYGEWHGAIALGDSAANVAAALTMVGDYQAPQRVWYRAQTSPSAPAAGAVWQAAIDATLIGLLPPTNAYLGVKILMNHLGPPPNLTTNPSFEADPPNVDGSSLTGWTRSNSSGTIGSWINSGLATEGSRIGRVTSTAAGITVGLLSPVIPAVPGATYRASGWVGRGAVGIRAGRIRISSYLGATQVTAAAAQTDKTPAGATLEYLEAFYTVPTDATVDGLRVAAMIVSANAGEYVNFDEVQLHGPPVADVTGADRLAVTWESLG